jgi:hypothetical protein
VFITYRGIGSSEAATNVLKDEKTFSAAWRIGHWFTVAHHGSAACAKSNVRLLELLRAKPVLL